MYCRIKHLGSKEPMSGKIHYLNMFKDQIKERGEIDGGDF
jgi:hypothetical protein